MPCRNAAVLFIMQQQRLACRVPRPCQQGIHKLSWQGLHGGGAAPAAPPGSAQQQRLQAGCVQHLRARPLRVQLLLRCRCLLLRLKQLPWKVRNELCQLPGRAGEKVGGACLLCRRRAGRRCAARCAAKVRQHCVARLQRLAAAATATHQLAGAAQHVMKGVERTV